MNARVAKKPLSRNILRRFEPICLGLARAKESGFVNHSVASVPNQFFEGVSPRALLGAAAAGEPTLSPRGEEGDWHARIAD
jgi:hypothetical protein